MERLDEQLAVLRKRRSDGLPIVLAQKARLLAEDLRIHEALDVLREASTDGYDLGESVEALERERDALAVEMAQAAVTASAPQATRRALPPRHLIPSSVEVRDKGNGQFGLFATEAMDADTVAFRESPMAVLAAPGGYESCAHCLRPLTKSVRVLASDGADMTPQFSDDQLLQLRSEAGLPMLQRDGAYCTPECRIADGDRGRTVAAQDGKEIEQLAERLRPELVDIVTKYLWQCTFPVEPSGLSARQLRLWRAVRGNALQVQTQALSLAVQGPNLEPILDPQVIVSGSALFFGASFANHSCVRPNVMPSYMDSLLDTPFVTLHDVAQGEELLLDYSSDVTHAADKRVRVYLSHGFVCQCEAHT